MSFGSNNNTTSNNNEDIDTERDTNTRSAYTTNDAIKKEDPDVEYESLLAPAIIKPGYDAENDVEIVGCFSGKINSQKTSRAPTSLTNSHNKQVYRCWKCKRFLGNKGAWTKHILACNTKKRTDKKERKRKDLSSLHV